MVKTIVYAKSIDKVHFKFECPFCYDKYKKDGITPTKNAKKLFHIHGSNENLRNRRESRIAHCNNKIYNGSFEIIIDDSTIKN